MYNSRKEFMTSYHLESACCGTTFEDKEWELECPHKDGAALIYANYAKRQFEVRNDLSGIYRYANWMPICRTLEGSGAPVTYKSEGLAEYLGLSNLYITFNGYWPERNAVMKTGSFKECEAYSVCARNNAFNDKIMVVASAGNTARAFGRVCSENHIPLLLCVPEDNLEAIWADGPWNDCVKLVCAASGCDYFDAIHLSNIICEMEFFYPEGGAKNVARRDGMGTTVLSAVETIGRIPDYYFQAVGSGTGAIAAWEANKRFIADGRFGSHFMKLMVSQNAPFTLMYDAWKAGSRTLLALDENMAREQVKEMCAKVLSNRKPPYSLKGGLYDALVATGGDMFLATNEETMEAKVLFEQLEGIEKIYQKPRNESCGVFRTFEIRIFSKKRDMNRLKEHKGINLLLRYKKEILRRMDCLLDLDYHYMVLRRDYGNRFVITEFLQKALSIVVVSFNRFIKDACTISASALTFYSILSFIPLMALAFALAAGFGAREALEKEFMIQLGDNQEFAGQLLGYVSKAIDHAKGGVITGVGIVILLWSVIKVLNSTEMTMNRIWGVRKGRSLRRMFTDYFSIIFIAPILMILVSSLNLFMTSSGWQENFPLISSFLQIVIKLLPYMLVWMLFIFLYMFMPATPVKFKHAFVAAMIAGTVYQIIQWFYIRFQIGMSSYSAIYGTLAALPLLLVWLQLSWSVVLWGTELCYILRNRHFMYKNELFGDTAWMETLECALKVMKFVARVYVNGEGGPSLGMINKELKINTGKLRIVLQELVDLHILVEAKEEDDYFYYPAFDLHTMSVGDIIVRFSRVDESRDEIWKKQFKETVLSGFAGDRLIVDSGAQQ